MSYIYEALKRAEDENAKGVGARRAARRPAFFASRPRWWLWALIGVLGANAALLVTLVLPRGSRPPDVTMATTSTEPAVAAAPPASPVAPTSPVARAAPPPAPSGAPASRPAPPAPPVAERPAPAIAPSVPVAAPVPKATVPSTVARDTADAPPTSPRTVGPTPLAAPSVPVVAPSSTGPASGGPPKLHIQVVVYSDVPAQRMVFIDGRRYAEGDRVDADTVVDRITPDGAVVTRRGQRLTLTSGRP